jgi:hypothetical protein
MTQGQIIEPKTALAFILAGKATVTLRSLVSGNRYTYKIVVAKKRNPSDPDTWFVSVLNGPDNGSDYSRLGMIKNGEFRWYGKCHVSSAAPSFIGFNFCLKALNSGSMRDFEVWHEGRCGRCGRPLTVPESIATGFGPDCAEMLGMAAVPAPVIASGVAANPVMNDSPRSDKKFLAAFAEPQRKESGVLVAHNVGDLDAMIRARIETYKSEAPENYYQDGELDEKQAYNVAYNKFRVQIERESQ